jgi:hypothetical protein
LGCSIAGAVSAGRFHVAATTTTALMIIIAARAATKRRREGYCCMLVSFKPLAASRSLLSRKRLEETP